MTVEEDFRVRPGRIRQGGARSRSFVAQVLRAAVRAGYVSRGGGGRRPGMGRGRGAVLAAGLRSPGRRVVVKARVVRHLGRAWRAASLATHIGYLKRDGVGRAGGRGDMFDARGVADERAFAARCEGDRHHFRFIVSPEEAAEMADLRRFCRDLMGRAEADLGTALDWIAVDHWNTAHPHLHVIVRGVDADGADLVIDGGYLGRGLRARAEALVELELGPRTAREIAAGLERDAAAERWTGLDGLLAADARGGLVDLRPGAGAREASVRLVLLARAEKLERLGMAWPEGVGVWRLAPDLRARLGGLAERAQIVAALRRVAGEGRSLDELRPDGEALAAPLVGRLLDRGLHDELSGRAYAVVDGLDGCVRYIRLRDLDAAGDTPLGGLVELRPGPEGVRLLHRSDLDLGRQVRAEGAVWLDRQLVAREPSAVAEGGFGAEARAALGARVRWLAERGLARLSPEGAWRFVPDLLGVLRRRELAAAGARLERETGLAFRSGEREPEVAGRYRRRVDLASGRFAMVEDGRGFRLVPWARVLDRRLGREVSGRLSASGVDWDLGRRPGLDR